MTMAELVQDFADMETDPWKLAKELRQGADELHKLAEEQRKLADKIDCDMDEIAGEYVTYQNLTS
jgi:hypothetical protein